MNRRLLEKEKGELNAQVSPLVARLKIIRLILKKLDTLKEIVRHTDYQGHYSYMPYFQDQTNNELNPIIDEFVSKGYIQKLDDSSWPYRYKATDLARAVLEESEKELA